MSSPSPVSGSSVPASSAPTVPTNIVGKVIDKCTTNSNFKIGEIKGAFAERSDKALDLKEIGKNKYELKITWSIELKDSTGPGKDQNLIEEEVLTVSLPEDPSLTDEQKIAAALMIMKTYRRSVKDQLKPAGGFDYKNANVNDFAKTTFAKANMPPVAGSVKKELKFEDSKFTVVDFDVAKRAKKPSTATSKFGRVLEQAAAIKGIVVTKHAHLAVTPSSTSASSSAAKAPPSSAPHIPATSSSTSSSLSAPSSPSSSAVPAPSSSTSTFTVPPTLTPLSALLSVAPSTPAAPSSSIKASPPPVVKSERKEDDTTVRTFAPVSKSSDDSEDVDSLFEPVYEDELLEDEPAIAPPVITPSDEPKEVFLDATEGEAKEVDLSGALATGVAKVITIMREQLIMMIENDDTKRISKALQDLEKKDPSLNSEEILRELSSLRTELNWLQDQPDESDET